MPINHTKKTSTFARLSLITITSLSLSYCGAFKERSAETREFMDSSDINQLSIKKNSSNKSKASDANDAETNDSTNQPKQNLSGSALVYSSDQNPDAFSHKTRFLTENDTLGPLRGSNNQKIALSELEKVIENEGLNMPNGSDLGSYIFHHKVNLGAKSMHVRTLPETAYQAVGINNDTWKSALAQIESNCDQPLQSIWVDSNMAFELNDFSFQDFEVNEAFLEDTDQGVSKNQVTFEMLNSFVKEKLLDAFNPNLQKTIGKTNSFFAVCDQDNPKIWKFDGQSFVAASKISPSSEKHQILFRHTIPKTYLKNIALNNQMTLLDVTMGKDYKLFQREQYRNESEYHLPLSEILDKIKNQETIQEESQASTSEKPYFAQKEDDENEVTQQDPQENYFETIYRNRMRRSVPASGDYTLASARVPSKTTATPEVIEDGDEDDFKTYLEQFASWHPAYQFNKTLSAPTSNNQDALHSLVLKRHSKIFYDLQTQEYFPPTSTHIQEVENGKTIYTPNSLMWNDNAYRTHARSQNDVDTLCQDYPLQRTVAFYAHIHPPLETEQKKPYLIVGNTPKTMQEVVMDQLSVDSTGHDIVSRVLWHGAMSPTPMKSKQKWHLKFCLNPEEGTYKVFWKSTESQRKWNEEISWKTKYIDSADILIANEKPWIEASQSSVLLKQHVNRILPQLPKKDRRVFENRMNKNPTQIKIVCAQTKKRCHVVFQAAIRRPLDPRILAYYLAHPSQTGEFKNISTAPKVYDMIIKTMASQLPDKIRKNEIMVYGGFELDQIEEPQKQVKYLSLKSLDKNGIYTPKDPEILHDVDVYFPGETADLYLGGTVESIPVPKQKSTPVTAAK